MKIMEQTILHFHDSDIFHPKTVQKSILTKIHVL